MPSQPTTATKTYPTRLGWLHGLNAPPKRGKIFQKIINAYDAFFSSYKSTPELTAYPIGLARRSSFICLGDHSFILNEQANEDPIEKEKMRKKLTKINQHQATSQPLKI